MSTDRPTFSESWYRVAELTPRLLGAVNVQRQHFQTVGGAVSAKLFQVWHQRATVRAPGGPERDDGGTASEGGGRVEGFRLGGERLERGSLVDITA